MVELILLVLLDLPNRRSILLISIESGLIALELSMLNAGRPGVMDAVEASSRVMSVW